MWQRRCLVEVQHFARDDQLPILGFEIELGRLLGLSGNIDEAQTTLEHCLTQAERYSGSDHRGRTILAKCLQQLGVVETFHGQPTDAEIHIRRAFGYFDDIPGDFQPLRCVEDLNLMLVCQERYSEAEDLCRQSLQECMEVYGSEHAHTAIILQMLGGVLQGMGRMDEALEISMRALEGHQRVDNDWHSQRALSTMGSIAEGLQEQENLWEAADLSEQVYRLYIDRIGPEAIFTLDKAERYARSLNMIKKHEQAIDSMRSCAMISRRILGPDHPDAVERTLLLAKWEKAELKRKVQYFEICFKLGLFWPFILFSVFELILEVGIILLKLLLECVRAIIAGCTKSLCMYLIDLLSVLVDVVSRISGIDLCVV